MTKESSNIPEKDWLLSELVDFANMEMLNIGITLTIKGTIVFGTLIGMKEYYSEHGKIWGNLTESSHAKKIEKQWQDMGSNTLNELKKQKKENKEAPSPTFIHLKNARYMSGDVSIPTQGGMLWRGKIKDVNGFSIGVFGRE